MQVNKDLFKDFQLIKNNSSISSVNNSVNNIKTDTTPKEIQKNSKSAIYVLSGIVAFGAIIGGIAYSAKKGRKIKNSPIEKVIPDNLKIIDKDFKDSIIRGLREKFGIKTVKIADLNSIVGPEEFLDLVKKYSINDYRISSDFVVDMQGAADRKLYERSLKNWPLDKLETYYKPIKNGKFRISLHTHSNFSDGKATSFEFIESARKYADKVARLNPDDGKPPFLVALTDHDNVDGCQEIIKIISQNPEKYKNLKFVSGCEFSVKNKVYRKTSNSMFQEYIINHDLTGLALNPFDEKLIKMLNDLKNAREKTLRDFLKTFQNPLDKHQYTLEELVEEQSKENGFKSDKRTLQTRSGVVYVRHAIECLQNKIKQSYNQNNRPYEDIINYLRNKIDELDKTDIPDIEKVINTVKENKGFTSLTHPMKSFWGDLDAVNLTELKRKGVDGIEAYQQYSPSKYYELKEYHQNNTSPFYAQSPNEIAKKLMNYYESFAKKNDMFISGGTDCHEKTQIFSREPAISQELLDLLLNSD